MLKESVFVDHLLQRSRFLRDNFLTCWTDRTPMRCVNSPINFASALRREQPLDQQIAELDEAINRADFAERRRQLLDQLEQLARPLMTEADIHRLARLGRDGKGAGLVRQSLTNMLLGNRLAPFRNTYLFRALCDEVFRGLLWEQDHHSHQDSKRWQEIQLLLRAE